MGFYHPSFVERLVFTLQSILQLLGICALDVSLLTACVLPVTICYCYQVLQHEKEARFHFFVKKMASDLSFVNFHNHSEASSLFNHDDVASTPSSPLLRCPTHVDGGRQYGLFGRAFLY